jgi:hypothetical protein
MPLLLRRTFAADRHRCAEGREALLGIFFVRVNDLDEACAIAGESPHPEVAARPRCGCLGRCIARQFEGAAMRVRAAWTSPRWASSSPIAAASSGSSSWPWS